MNAPLIVEPFELIVDSFAGGGGTSEGIRQAVGRDPDIAINHDALALAMHRINHPGTHHMVEDVWHVDALGMCDGRPIGLLWLSPDCKHFSKAKGGKPREKAIRGLAWVGLRWVKSLPRRQRPRVVILENVEEFQDWGPLLADGRPCPVQKGATFKSYVGGFRSLGYEADWRELRACDYGDPTIRKRLFVILRRDGKAIVWPARTHGNPKDKADAALIAAGVLKPWRTAAEIIDFSLPCPSIFETSAEIKATLGLRANRPLADNTLSRVAKGTMRYVVNASQPFIVPVTHAGDARVHGVDEPLRTVTTARRGEHALVTPFVTRFNTGAIGHAVDQPLATVTSHASPTHGGGAAPLGLVAPLVVRVDQTSGKASRKGVNAADEPLRTITTAGGHALVAPILVGCGGRAGQSEPRPADEPVLTQTAKADACIVAPFMVPRYQPKDGQGPRLRAVDEPSATVMPRGNEGVLAAVHLSTMRNSEKPFSAADEPAQTMTAGGANAAVISAFMVPRYGERPGQEPRTRPVDEPAAVIVPTANEGSLAAVHLSRQFGASVGSAADEPVGTVTAGGGGKTAVVAAFLAQHNGDRSPKPGRGVDEPLSTIVAAGGTSRQAVVAAYMAQHNTDVVGHPVDEPVSTIVGKGCTQGLVQASFLSHAYTSNTAGGNGDLERPLKTTLAGGQHAALVAAFLAKYYGAGEPVQAANDPLHTVTAKPRHGLVTVTMAGEPYVITDIGMRMLTPRERFSAQGFRPDYVIDQGLLEDGSRVVFTLEQQGRMCGNSVCPGMARALVGANYQAPSRPVQLPRLRTAPLLEPAD